jgi:hypothetical protein
MLIEAPLISHCLTTEKTSLSLQPHDKVYIDDFPQLLYYWYMDTNVHDYWSYITIPTRWVSLYASF